MAVDTLISVRDEYNDVVYAVKDRCVACGKTQVYYSEKYLWIFNIRSGLLHIPHYDYNDKTACGKDCTGKTWLHRQ